MTVPVVVSRHMVSARGSPTSTTLRVFGGVAAAGAAWPDGAPAGVGAACGAQAAYSIATARSPTRAFRIVLMCGASSVRKIMAWSLSSTSGCTMGSLGAKHPAVKPVPFTDDVLHEPIHNRIVINRVACRIDAC